MFLNYSQEKTRINVILIDFKCVKIHLVVCDYGEFYNCVFIFIFIFIFFFAFVFHFRNPPLQ